MLFSIELINIIQYLHYEDIRNIINTCKKAVEIFEKPFYLDFTKNKSKYHYMYSLLKPLKIGDRVYICDIHPKTSRYTIRTTYFHIRTCEECMRNSRDELINSAFATTEAGYSYRRLYRI
jgi:hypothetical protein